MSYFDRVTRVPSRVSFLSVAALLVACGGGAVRPPAAPPKPVDPETRVEPRREDDPRLIAPPPAYGNKVVMARAGTTGTIN